MYEILKGFFISNYFLVDFIFKIKYKKFILLILLFNQKNLFEIDTSFLKNAMAFYGI